MSSPELRKRMIDFGYSNLLNICLDLHMQNSGSYDGMNKVVFKCLVSILEDALNEWKETTHLKYKQFDDAVKNLIIATLEECKVNFLFI